MVWSLVRCVFCVWLVGLGPLQAQQQIAITIDDLPYVQPSRTSPEQGLAQARAVIRALGAHRIRAVGFVVGQQARPETWPILDAWTGAGHLVGNHTWRHGDYSDQGAWTFRREVRRTHRAIARWQSDTGPRYFRFPYLRTGATQAAKQAAEAVLAQWGYINLPVTIDNDDWRFNAAYLDALEAGDKEKAAKIAEDYLAHIQERTAHFQALAGQALGRDVAHVLLLHMNQINADHLDRLLAWYAAEGWTFVTVEEALKDPLYAMPDLYAGPRGLSQIERVLGDRVE